MIEGLTRKRPLSRGRLLMLAVVILAIVLVTYPAIFVILRSLSTDNIGSALTFEWFQSLFESEMSREAIRNTVVYTIGSTVFAMVAGVSAAFLTTRTNLPGRRIVALLMVLPMLVPPFIQVVGWNALGDPSAGFINLLASWLVGRDVSIVNVTSMPGLIWVTGLFLTPYVYLLVSSGFSTSDQAAEEAARVSGASPWKVIRTVILPMQRPALLGAALLVAVMSAGDFVIPATLGLKGRIHMLSSLIWQNHNSFPAMPGLAAAQAVLLVLIGVIGISLQRYALSRGSRFTVVGGKGLRPGLFDLGRFRRPAGVIGMVVAIGVTLLPVLAVLSMGFMRYWTPTAFRFENFTLRNFRYILFDYPQVWQAVKNSLFLGIAGATLTVLVAVVLSWYTLRFKGRLSGVVDVTTILPLGIPHIAIGMGILSAWILVPGGPYGTIWILLIAYITSTMPVAMQFVGSALRRIHTELEEASRVSGRSAVATMMRVSAPLMRPALIGGWVLLYVVILREISLVILLYTPQSIVLSVGLMDVWSSGFYTELAVYSLVLLVLGLAPLLVLWRFVRTRFDAASGGTI